MRAEEAELNEYERARAAKIAENKAKLAQLGLIEASRALLSTVQGPSVMMEAGSEVQPRKKRRVAKEVAPVVLEATRQSSRIRGEAAPSLQQAVQEAQQEAEEDETLGRTKKGGARKKLTLGSSTYEAPFSLWSIGVTVWELGHIHRGAWAQRYWSSSGCLFHHAYPVGYRATKVQFGRTYEMTIEAGPTGPIFRVTDQRSGVSFAGESPTKPWTDVCLAHRTGQRISGPLFFGFSDIVTQRAIAGLYSPHELQAALQGERVSSAEQSAEERAAAEFQAVEGIGEATAMALAYSTALGCRQHAGLVALRAWVQESEANQAQLREWLTSSEELPAATRKWPAWRLRMVPKIVASLAGNDPIPAPAAEGQAAGSRAKAAARRAALGAGAAEGSGAGQGTAGELQAERQQQWEPAAGASPKAARSAAGGHAKENRPGNSSRPAGAGGRVAVAGGAAAAPAAAPRASGRQRKANSKYVGDEFFVELGE